MGQAVEQAVLSSIAWEDEEWPHESFCDYLMRCIKYQKNPQKFKKHRAAFRVLVQGHEHAYQEENKAPDDRTTWQDLSLFGPSSILEVIDRMHTQMGRAFAACLLASPVTDVIQLQKRQNIAKTFLKNQQLFDRLTQSLTQLQRAENLMLSFWLNDPLEQTGQRHYFSVFGAESLNDYLNGSSTALGIRSLLNTQLNITHTCVTAAGTVVLPLYLVAHLAGYEPSDEIRGYVTRLRNGGTLLLVSSMLAKQLGSGNASHAVYCGNIAADGLMYGLSIKSQFDWAYGNLIFMQCLHEKMIAVAQYVGALKDIKECLDEYASLKADLRHAHSLDVLFETLPLEVPECTQLLELLQTDTFQGDPSYVSHHGRILAAYRLMHLMKERLAPALVAGAELDAYLSVARLMQEFEHERVGFCFARYVSADHPYIELQNFWNPLVSHKVVVPNSVTLDGSKPGANMILTGPNAGGKSTTLKALPINLILGQTFGILAASQGVVTVFEHIATHLNIVDDIASGNSLFKAEVIRAHKLIEAVEKLPAHQFSFIAMDEMMSGTSPREGCAAAYSVAKHLGKFPNSLCAIATHFQLLTRLEFDTPHFTVYRVSVQVDEAGKITYPFKLEKGVSNQHVALDILRAEGFDSGIIADAQQVLAGQVSTL